MLAMPAWVSPSTGVVPGCQILAVERPSGSLLLSAGAGGEKEMPGGSEETM